MTPWNIMQITVDILFVAGTLYTQCPICPGEIRRPGNSSCAPDHSGLGTSVLYKSNSDQPVLNPEEGNKGRGCR